jgi:DNA repair exonuclease SbcCD ATPase subunit
MLEKPLDFEAISERSQYQNLQWEIDLMNMPDERLNNALNSLREYLQGTARDVVALRETSHNGGQRLGQLTADVEMLRQELQGVRQSAPELNTLRQELLVALREIDNLHCQRVDQLTTDMDTLRQELLAALREIDNLHCQRVDQLTAEVGTLRQELSANLRETSDTRSQRLDQLADDLETMSQGLLAALREAGDVRDQRLDQLATDLDALRQELQEARQNAPDLDTLRREWQNTPQNTSDLDTLRQELQGIRQNNSELERSLRTQWVKAREQLEVHTRELAALTERTQTQSQEMSEHIQTLTGLHKQEQSQRETALATLSKLNERTSSLEQQMSANQTQASDTLRVDQNRLAALEKWLTTQAEQFSRFDPILRELHSELVSAHQRLAALESAGIAEMLDQHEQRLSEAEQQAHNQSDTLDEVQQTLAQLATQGLATAKLNRTLIGALAAAGVIIIVLLVILVAG